MKRLSGSRTNVYTHVSFRITLSVHFTKVTGEACTECPKHVAKARDNFLKKLQLSKDRRLPQANSSSPCVASSAATTTIITDPFSFGGIGLGSGKKPVVPPVESTGGEAAVVSEGGTGSLVYQSIEFDEMMSLLDTLPKQRRRHDGHRPPPID